MQSKLLVERPKIMLTFNLLVVIGMGLQNPLISHPSLVQLTYIYNNAIVYINVGGSGSNARGRKQQENPLTHKMQLSIASSRLI